MERRLYLGFVSRNPPWGDDDDDGDDGRSPRRTSPREAASDLVGGDGDGGEGSDDDRYCSASSFLGSPSVCSSVGTCNESLPFVLDHLRGQDLQSPGGGGGDRELCRRLSSPGFGVYCSAGGGFAGGSPEEQDDIDQESEDDSLCSSADGGARHRCVEEIELPRKLGFGMDSSILMNSSTAFGSDDWDEFERETSGDDPLSLLLPAQHGTAEQTSAGDSLSLRNRVCIPRDVTETLDSEVHNFDCSMDNATMHHIRSSLAVGVSFQSENPISEVCASENSVDHPGELALPRENQGPAPLDDSDRGVRCHELQVPELSCSNTSNLEFRYDGPSSFPMNIVSSPKGNVNVVHSNFNEEADEHQEVRKHSTDDIFDEMVQEMEEILLDSGKSKPHGSLVSMENQTHILRDGSSTASVSVTDVASHGDKCFFNVDWIEVVGAKQKNGDVSLGERLFGVKEYTVYNLRVWGSSRQWEVERRYRDFFALYRRLKTLFASSGLSLPGPWNDVERESRFFFGTTTAPYVISQRSTLIQDSLQSILNCKTPSETSSYLVRFLSPCNDIYCPGLGCSAKASPSHSIKKSEDEDAFLGTSGGVATIGKTISLTVAIRADKSIRQLLEAQRYTCAGCHTLFSPGRTRFQELVQTLGWNKPRFCEYTGQLFCASCHANETAVIPAKALHLWDFTLYPVSQLAKAYLDSIYDQPMLCVSAVNPLLFSKVPALLHVMGVRRKIGTVFPYLRCPFRRSVHVGLGFRRYLLEDNDFFSLRDLVDLSKGAFAALPVLVETISSKIIEHITQQCLICCDAAVPCAARRVCEDISSLIFPFQEAEAVRCVSCRSIFHEPCCRKLVTCHCGKPLGSNYRADLGGHETRGRAKESDGVSESSKQAPAYANPMPGFFSGIFSKSQQKTAPESERSNRIILLSPLPSAPL